MNILKPTNFRSPAIHLPIHTFVTNRKFQRESLKFFNMQNVDQLCKAFKSTRVALIERFSRGEFYNRTSFCSGFTFIRAHEPENSTLS